KQRKNWKKVRFGLLLMLIGWWPVTVITVLWAIYTMILLIGELGGSGPGVLSQKALAVMTILLLLAEFVTITGLCFCFYAPPDSNVQWWLIAPLAFALFRTITCLGSIIALLQSEGSAGPIWLLVALVFFLGQWIGTLLFLRAVSHVLYSHA